MYRLKSLLIAICPLFTLICIAQTPKNLFYIDDLWEIEPHVDAIDLMDITPVELEGNLFLKITCESTTWTPPVFFKALNVNPGETYTYFLSAVTSENLEAYFQVESPSAQTNIVWPGAKIETGITQQTFTIPDGIYVIRIGLAFVHPDPKENILISDIGLYPGWEIASHWVVSENEGLQPWLRQSNTHWLWLLFPFSICVFVVLRYIDKK